MKKLTLPLSALLVGHFKFMPGSMTPSFYIPKKGVVVGEFDLRITRIEPWGEVEEYEVWYSDGSNLTFGKDEIISVSV